MSRSFRNGRSGFWPTESPVDTFGQNGCRHIQSRTWWSKIVYPKIIRCFEKIECKKIWKEEVESYKKTIQHGGEPWNEDMNTMHCMHWSKPGKVDVKEDSSFNQLGLVHLWRSHQGVQRQLILLKAVTINQSSFQAHRPEIRPPFFWQSNPTCLGIQN